MSIWKLVLLGAVVVIASGGELVSGKKQKKEEKGYVLKLKLLVEAKEGVSTETLTAIHNHAGNFLGKLKPEITLADSKSATVTFQKKIRKAKLRNILKTNEEDDIDLYVVIKGAGTKVGKKAVKKRGRVCDTALLRRVLVVTLEEEVKDGEKSIDVKKMGKRLAGRIVKKLGGAKSCAFGKRKGSSGEGDKEAERYIKREVNERAQDKDTKNKKDPDCSIGVQAYIQTFTDKKVPFCLSQAA